MYQTDFCPYMATRSKLYLANSVAAVFSELVL